MMVTVAGSFQATGAPAFPVGLGAPSDEPPVFGPINWTHEVQLRIARLLAHQKRDRSDAADVVTDDAAVTPADATVPTSADSVVVAAQLEGIQLAAREIAHLVNNDLAVTVGTLDLLRSRGDVPVQVLEMLDQALAGLSAATSHVDQLQRVQRVVTRETPAGPSLDLDRSV